MQNAIYLNDAQNRGDNVARWAITPEYDLINESDWTDAENEDYGDFENQDLVITANFYPGTHQEWAASVKSELLETYHIDIDRMCVL